MENKKNRLLYLIIILLVIIIVLLAMLLLFRDKDDTNTINNSDVNNSELNKDETNNTEIVYSKEELFDKLKGIWKFVDNNGTNYATRFVVENGTLRFSNGKYGTDGGIYGEVIDSVYQFNGIYRLEIFSKGCHGMDCLYEEDDATYYIDVDINDIDNKKFILSINDNSDIYEYVGDTWEEVENSFTY